MYGMVNRAVEGLVCSKFGEDQWEKIKARAGVEEDVFLSNESYPDALTYRLVGAASEVLGLPPEAILEAFGEHWIELAQSSYGELMTMHGRNLGEFLNNLPNFHTRVALLFPKLQPPRFTVSNETPNSLHLHYYTHREGLAPFVVGLLKGLGRMFETPVTIDHCVRRGPGQDHDVFAVAWPPSGA
jgi:hypothetical protein